MRRLYLRHGGRDIHAGRRARGETNIQRLVLLSVFLLSSCAAGVSTRCGYDWNYGPQQHLICETRFHHRMKPSMAVAYSYTKDGEIVELVPTETSSYWSDILGGLAGAAP